MDLDLSGLPKGRKRFLYLLVANVFFMFWSSFGYTFSFRFRQCFLHVPVDGSLDNCDVLVTFLSENKVFFSFCLLYVLAKSTHEFQSGNKTLGARLGPKEILIAAKLRVFFISLTAAGRYKRAPKLRLLLLR